MLGFSIGLFIFIKKSGLLEYYETQEQFAHLAGDYRNARRDARHPELCPS